MGAKILRYGIIKLDFENTAVIKQHVETNNQNLFRIQVG